MGVGMNDYKKLLDALDGMDFFCDRAGKELWFDKPKEVQDEDIAFHHKTLTEAANAREERITMTLDYDPTRHEYRVDGKLVPSVTQLVAPLGQDYDEPDDLTESVLDAATERGTTMHEYLAWRLNGGTREEFELPDLYDPYADAVELFLYEHDICPFAIETPVCGAWRGVTYAGTPDLVGEFDGILSILDYKFVSQIAKSKVGAQLHGYRVLCEQNGVYPGDLYAVQFLNTGDYRLYCVGAGAADSFNACVEIYAQKTKKHPRGAIN